MSDRQADKRITVTGGEIVDRYINDSHPVVLYLGHYANWEWVPSVVRHFKAPNSAHRSTSLSTTRLSTASC